MGYASAQAWLLFIVIVATTLLVFRSTRRFVYYAGEGA
jgi:multiple sugar transport system permease protein